MDGNRALLLLLLLLLLRWRRLPLLLLELRLVLVQRLKKANALLHHACPTVFSCEKT